MNLSEYLLYLNEQYRSSDIAKQIYSSSYIKCISQNKCNSLNPIKKTRCKKFCDKGASDAVVIYLKRLLAKCSQSENPSKCENILKSQIKDFSK